MNPEFDRLIKTDINARGPEWEADFFAELLKERVQVLYSQPQPGPDGFSYLLVESGGTEPLHQILDWLATRGIGLVLNPRQTYPDYVFTYGMIWNYRERGEFLSPAQRKPQSRLELSQGSQIWVAQPSTSYLPDYVRALLKQFLADQGVSQPRIALVSQDGEHYDFAVSLESLGEPPESERMGVAEAIGWFLPAHYSVVLLPESVVEGFIDL